MLRALFFFVLFISAAVLDDKAQAFPKPKQSDQTKPAYPLGPDIAV